jgi:hypothetical protein
MLVGGYSIEVYCDQKLERWDHQWRGEGYGQTRAQALKDLLSQGWKIHRDNTATCPQCCRSKDDGQ